MTTHQNYKNVQTMNLKPRLLGDKDMDRDKFMWWKYGKWVYHNLLCFPFINSTFLDVQVQSTCHENRVLFVSDILGSYSIFMQFD